MKKLCLYLVCLALLSVVVFASDPVVFDGEFLNGTTLFSQVYSVSEASFVGKDAYPVHECVDVQVCKKYEVLKTCQRYSPRGTCAVWKSVKTNNCLVWGTRSVCTAQTPIICYNPNGVATNQLSLVNFYYSVDGTNWNVVPYTPYSHVDLSGISQLQFKVVIPEVCSPKYEVNKAITLLSSA